MYFLILYIVLNYYFFYKFLKFSDQDELHGPTRPIKLIVLRSALIRPINSVCRVLFDHRIIRDSYLHAMVFNLRERSSSRQSVGKIFTGSRELVVLVTVFNLRERSWSCQWVGKIFIDSRELVVLVYQTWPKVFNYSISTAYRRRGWSAAYHSPKFS